MAYSAKPELAKLKKKWASRIARHVTRDMVSRGKAQEMCEDMFDKVVQFFEIDKHDLRFSREQIEKELGSSE